jgi:trigger factor
VPIDDELAKKIGLDSLDQLKERLREQLQADYGRASRTHLKRRILDALDTAHNFDLPKGMVDAEFDMIWRQVKAELEREGASPEDEGKSEEELQTEYRGIAERRVKLGLILAKVGEQNAISINQDEVGRALAARARQFPGQEKQVVDYYVNNQQAMAELRVPIFEDKVIDFLAELIQVEDNPVTPEILFLDPDEAEERMKAQNEAEAAMPAGESPPAEQAG